MLLVSGFVEEDQADVVQVERDACFPVGNDFFPPLPLLLRAVDASDDEATVGADIRKHRPEDFLIIRSMTDVQAIYGPHAPERLLQPAQGLGTVAVRQGHGVHGAASRPHIADGCPVAHTHLDERGGTDIINQSEQQTVHFLSIMGQATGKSATLQHAISIVRMLFVNDGGDQKEIGRRVHTVATTMAETAAPIPDAMKKKHILSFSYVTQR